MDPSIIKDLTELFQSGGNIAAIIAIYIGLRLLDAVKKFLGDVQSTLKQAIDTNQRIIQLLERHENAKDN